jgi:multiple sugar transport system substrate-binding protein
MRPFEIVLIAIFAIAGIGGLVFFSTYKPAPDPTAVLYGDKVVIWGTFDKALINDFFFKITRENQAFEVVSYKQIEERSFQEELLNAIADGKAPDLVIVPHTMLVTYRSKFQVIPYTTLPERTFRDTYIDGAEIFMRSDGTYAVPLAADPLIMYWNRDIFSESGIAIPPKTWETLVSQTTRSINKVDDWFNFTQNAIAFGEYSNVTNAKNILSMLMLQAGTDIVSESERGTYSVTINGSGHESLSPGIAALSFYTQFATPGKDTYSWNRAMNTDRTQFLSGKLGMYFGMGSERSSLEHDNANLNYDVARVPQGGGANVQRNYADFYGFAIPRASKNVQGAYAVATYLASPEQAKKFAELYDLAPVQRSLYSESNSEPFKDILYQSALISRGWLDPDPERSSDLFRSMIEDAALNQERIGTVVRETAVKLESLFN